MKTENDQERSEIDYMLGSRMAWLAMLGECLRQLGYDDSEVQRVKWVKEREATVSKLRIVCKEYGDNDWKNELHLVDVIENHLFPYLEQMRESFGLETERCAKIAIGAQALPNAGDEFANGWCAASIQIAQAIRMRSA